MITREQLLKDKVKIEKMIQLRLKALGNADRKTIFEQTFRLRNEIAGIDKILKNYDDLCREESLLTQKKPRQVRRTTSEDSFDWQENKSTVCV
jgi:hypothetical protein